MKTTVTESNTAAIRCDITGDLRMPTCTPAATIAQSAPIARVSAIGPWAPRITVPQSAAPAAIVMTAADICARNSSGVILCAGEVWVSARVDPAQNTPDSACSEIRAMSSQCTGCVFHGLRPNSDGVEAAPRALYSGSVADRPRRLGARITRPEALAGDGVDLDALGIAMVP